MVFEMAMLDLIEEGRVEYVRSALVGVGKRLLVRRQRAQR